MSAESPHNGFKPVTPEDVYNEYLAPTFSHSEFPENLDTPIFSRLDSALQAVFMRSEYLISDSYRTDGELKMTPARRAEEEEALRKSAEELRISSDPNVIVNVGGYNMAPEGFPQHRRRFLQTGLEQFNEVFSAPSVDTPEQIGTMVMAETRFDAAAD